MSVDPRITDTELAAINAAAVTREYRVQPHLGVFASTARPVLVRLRFYRLSHRICYQRVKILRLI